MEQCNSARALYNRSRSNGGRFLYNDVNDIKPTRYVSFYNSTDISINPR